jgi:hypothetical protein
MVAMMNRNGCTNRMDALIEKMRLGPIEDGWKNVLKMETIEAT